MSETDAPLPWQRSQWARFEAMLHHARVHHALLLSGAAGLGKEQFAETVARALVCESSSVATHRPCGACRGCKLAIAGSHPDLLRIAPAPERRIINVDQIRGALSKLVLTAHYATRRVAVVTPADALNRHAADTLLKTLEEPTGAVVFVLVTSRPSALPVTVRSRCLSVKFMPCRADEGRQWLEGKGVPSSESQRVLQWCGGAPLAALAAHRDGLMERVSEFVATLCALLNGQMGVVTAAQAWRTQGLEMALEWQLRIVRALMRRCFGAPLQADAFATQAPIPGLELTALNRICDELLELRSAVQRQLHPNEQLALENVAAAWLIHTRRG